MNSPIEYTTRVTIEVIHTKPLPHLAEMIAGRAWSIDGVKGSEVIHNLSEELLSQGFTLQELSIAAEGEIHRT